MHQFLKQEKEIRRWFEGHSGIYNYTLQRDNKYGYRINTSEVVDLSNQNLEFIPVKFGSIQSDFLCINNYLTSLEFAPTQVQAFICDNNCLETLIGCPQIIFSSFSCEKNNLTSLQGGPPEVERYFCGFNRLTTLKGIAKRIGSRFDAQFNDLSSLDYLPQEVNTRVELNLQNNPKLGQIQRITNFYDLQEYLDIERDQEKLEKMLINQNLSHKINKV